MDPELLAKDDFLMEKVSESTFNVYTAVVLAVASVFTLLAIHNYEVHRRKKRSSVLTAFAYLTMSALLTAFVFGTIGFGVGYIIGYSDRVQDEDVKRQRTQVSSLLVRMFWSILLSCGVGLIFTVQRKKATLACLAQLRASKDADDSIDGCPDEDLAANES